jgi:putative transposase
LLQHAGWRVGKDRVERIWRREGLKVPKKQKPRGRLWDNNSSCVRLRPTHANHVWSWDFVSHCTHDGRSVRLLNLIDEYTRKSLAVLPRRRWSSAQVIEVAAEAMLEHGRPEHIRSDNVLTREWQVERKKRFLSIPYGMKLTVSPSGFHMQGRSDRP